MAAGQRATPLPAGVALRTFHRGNPSCRVLEEREVTTSNSARSASEAGAGAAEQGVCPRVHEELDGNNYIYNINLLFLYLTHDTFYI